MAYLLGMYECVYVHSKVGVASIEGSPLASPCTLCVSSGCFVNGEAILMCAALLIGQRAVFWPSNAKSAGTVSRPDHRFRFAYRDMPWRYSSCTSRDLNGSSGIR